MKQILLPLSFLFAIGNLMAQNNLGTDSLHNHNSHQSWVGEYEYTDEASGIHYDLIIEEISGELTATMEIEANGAAALDGHFQCAVEATKDRVILTYISHAPFQSDPDFKPRGSMVLLHLHYEKGVLVTEWQGIMPPNFDGKANGKTYFRVLTH